MRRRAALRGAAIACVALAAATAASRADEALGLFDYRADRNARLGYLERLYADEGVVLSRRVVEEARARMPPRASYRVVLGPRLEREHRFTRVIVADFLRFFLLPRRRTSSADAEWVVCYGCDPDALGPGRFVVLADGGNGVLFGRLRR